MKFDGIKNIFKKEGVSNISISNKESKVIDRHRLYGILGVSILCIDFIVLYFLTKYFRISNTYIILLFATLPLIVSMIMTHISSKIFRFEHVNFSRTLFISAVFGLPSIFLSFMSPSQKLIMSHQLEKGLIVFGSFCLAFFLFRWMYSINKNKALKISLIYTVVNSILMVVVGVFIGYIFSEIIFPRLFNV